MGRSQRRSARPRAATSTTARCASSTRCASPCPTTPPSSATCASPATGSAGFHPFAAAAPAAATPSAGARSGFAFPAAIGAALGAEGPTVALCGDGGFLFACGELATVAQEQIPLTTVIVDDGGYGMLRYDQDVAGEPRFGVDLRTPDFAAMAEAFGIRAQTVEGLEDDFGAALAEHVADPSPSVLVARAEALIPPPTTSPRWYRRR